MFIKNLTITLLSFNNKAVDFHTDTESMCLAFLYVCFLAKIKCSNLMNVVQYAHSNTMYINV